MTTTTKTTTVTEADIEKYLAAKQEVSFKYNKAGAKIWYHARAIIGTGAIDNGKFAGWSVDHDVKINRYEAALYLEKYGLTVEQFVAAEKEFYATRYPKDEATAEDNVEVEENTANAEAEQSTAQVEETEEKFIYTTNRGNTREVKVGETGSTTRGMWYYYHEIGGLSEQDVIELATKKKSGEFVNALCKFIVTETDGSEEDDDESFTANVMPDEDDGSDDELIDPPDFQTVERNSGNYGTWINGEYVRFENHSIVYIDADRKRGFHFCKVNGKKFFYRQCGHKIAAAKIIEAYMNGEIAAEQSKAHHEFFYAHKLEVGKTFQVSFEITTADGREHFFSRTFDTFAEAKALVDEFTSTFSEPTLIVITQNKQNGDWYYSRDVDGTEKFFDVFKDFGSCMELRCTRSAMERKKNKPPCVDDRH